MPKTAPVVLFVSLLCAGALSSPASAGPTLAETQNKVHKLFATASFTPVDMAAIEDGLNQTDNHGQWVELSNKAEAYNGFLKDFSSLSRKDADARVKPLFDALQSPEDDYERVRQLYLKNCPSPSAVGSCTAPAPGAGSGAANQPTKNRPTPTLNVPKEEKGDLPGNFGQIADGGGGSTDGQLPPNQQTPAQNSKTSNAPAGNSAQYASATPYQQLDNVKIPLPDSSSTKPSAKIKPRTKDEASQLLKAQPSASDDGSMSPADQLLAGQLKGILAKDPKASNAAQYLKQYQALSQSGKPDAKNLAAWQDEVQSYLQFKRGGGMSKAQLAFATMINPLSLAGSKPDTATSENCWQALGKDNPNFAQGCADNPKTAAAMAGIYQAVVDQAKGLVSLGNVLMILGVLLIGGLVSGGVADVIALLMAIGFSAYMVYKIISEYGPKLISAIRALYNSQSGSAESFKQWKETAYFATTTIAAIVMIYLGAKGAEGLSMKLSKMSAPGAAAPSMAALMETVKSPAKLLAEQPGVAARTLSLMKGSPETPKMSFGPAVKTAGVQTAAAVSKGISAGMKSLFKDKSALDKPSADEVSAGDNAPSETTPPAETATSVGPKIEKQMSKRGWTDESLQETVKNADRTAVTRDTRNLGGGARMDDPATAFINEDGSYVVRNDRTGDIVQVSDRNNPNWKSPFQDAPGADGLTPDIVKKLRAREGGEKVAADVDELLSTEHNSGLLNKQGFTRETLELAGKQKEISTGVSDRSNVSSLEKALASVTDKDGKLIYGKTQAKLIVDDMMQKDMLEMQQLADKHGVKLGRGGAGSDEFYFSGEPPAVENFAQELHAKFPPDRMLKEAGFVEGTPEYEAVQLKLKERGRSGQGVGGFTTAITELKGKNLADLKASLETADSGVNFLKDNGQKGNIGVAKLGADGKIAADPLKAAESTAKGEGVVENPSSRQPSTGWIDKLNEVKKQTTPEEFASIEKAMFEDPLTGAKTQDYLKYKASEMNASYADGGGKTCVVSLEGLRPINNALNHAVGDVKLSQFGRVVGEVVNKARENGLDVQDPVKVGPNDIALVGKDAIKVGDMIAKEMDKRSGSMFSKEEMGRIKDYLEQNKNEANGSPSDIGKVRMTGGKLVEATPGEVDVVKSLQRDSENLSKMKENGPVKVDPERIEAAKNVLKLGDGEKFTHAQEQAIQRAHEVGSGQLGKDGVNQAGIDNYTTTQLSAKADILKKAGFTEAQRRTLMENGVVGEPLDPSIAPEPDGRTEVLAKYQSAFDQYVRNIGMDPAQLSPIERKAFLNKYLKQAGMEDSLIGAAMRGEEPKLQVVPKQTVAKAGPTNVLEFSQKVSGALSDPKARAAAGNNSALAKVFLKNLIESKEPPITKEWESAYNSGSKNRIADVQSKVQKSLMKGATKVLSDEGINPNDVWGHGTGHKAMAGIIRDGLVQSRNPHPGFSGESSHAFAGSIDTAAQYAARALTRGENPVLIIFEKKNGLKLQGDVLNMEPTLEQHIKGFIITDGENWTYLSKEKAMTIHQSYKAWTNGFQEGMRQDKPAAWKEFSEWEKIDEKLSPKDGTD